MTPCAKKGSEEKCGCGIAQECIRALKSRTNCAGQGNSTVYIFIASGRTLGRGLHPFRPRVLSDDGWKSQAEPTTFHHCVISVVWKQKCLRLCVYLCLVSQEL